MQEQKKFVLLAMLGVFIVILSGVGVSYAVWSTTLVQTAPNSIVSSCFDVDITDASAMTLNKEIPIPESAGKAKTPYTFQITNNCYKGDSGDEKYADVNYEVRLDILDGTDLDNQYINMLFGSSESSSEEAKKTDGVEVKLLSEAANGKEHSLEETDAGVTKSIVLDSGTLHKNSSKYYSLRFWIDDAVEMKDKEQVMNKHFKSKIHVIASYAPKKSAEESSG